MKGREWQKRKWSLNEGNMYGVCYAWKTNIKSWNGQFSAYLSVRELQQREQKDEEKRKASRSCPPCYYSRTQIQVASRRSGGRRAPPTLRHALSRIQPGFFLDMKVNIGFVRSVFCSFPWSIAALRKKPEHTTLLLPSFISLLTLFPQLYFLSHGLFILVYFLFSE